MSLELNNAAPSRLSFQMTQSAFPILFLFWLLVEGSEGTSSSLYSPWFYTTKMLDAVLDETNPLMTFIWVAFKFIHLKKEKWLCGLNINTTFYINFFGFVSSVQTFALDCSVFGETYQPNTYTSLHFSASVISVLHLSSFVITQWGKVSEAKKHLGLLPLSQ